MYPVRLANDEERLLLPVDLDRFVRARLPLLAPKDGRELLPVIYMSEALNRHIVFRQYTCLRP